MDGFGQRPQRARGGVQEVVRSAGTKARLPRRLPVGSGAEMSSLDEKRRFERMGKLTQDELSTADLADLAAKLQE